MPLVAAFDYHQIELFMNGPDDQSPFLSKIEKTPLAKSIEKEPAQHNI